MGTVLVSGGSGKIGRAICRALGAAGYSVFVGFNSQQDYAEQTAADIEAAGGRSIAGKIDVCSDESVDAAFAAAIEALGPVTALVNNAGVIGGKALVSDVESEIVRRVFDINVVGAFRCAKRAVRSMAFSRGGSGGAIINISSRASKLGNGGEWVHYAATKGAIDTFTVGLAREVASEGIRVNAVNPGLIATNIHADAGAPDRLERLFPHVPMGRPGTVDEVASTVRFLLSSEASYICGVCLEVSGGR